MAVPGDLPIEHRVEERDRIDQARQIRTANVVKTGFDDGVAGCV
jgi:hypothetical protein